MATYHNGYENIKVTLLNCAGNDLAKRVYQFGRLSNDFNWKLQENYDEDAADCKLLINKIIEGTTLPKFALQGTRIEFRIENISRICLAQLTRDNAIFASASTGVFPLTQDFNIPMSIYKDESLMKKLREAQNILEQAYIEACEKHIPNIEARYIGLHCQTISLTASYEISDFVRSCHSRTSSNFCDECNFVYRLMFRELWDYIWENVTDDLSMNLWCWLVPREKCINDGIYKRERLYNSDFTVDIDEFDEYKKSTYTKALFDWRCSGWKLELERMLKERPELLTLKEQEIVEKWLNKDVDDLPTTYDGTQPDVCENMIKTMDYYPKEHDYD